jgi:membrane-associated protein
MPDLVAGVLDGLAGLNTTALYLLAGTTATTPHRFAALVTVTVLGSLAGESVGYLLSRRYGPQLRVGRLGRRLGEDRWVAAEAFLAGRGGRAAAAARMSPSSMPLSPYRRPPWRRQA